MTSWYEKRQRADALAAALHEILIEANDLAGLADAIDHIGGNPIAAVLKGSAYGLRSAVGDLVDELHDDLEPAACFDREQLDHGHPADTERIAYLISLFREDRP